MNRIFDISVIAMLFSMLFLFSSMVMANSGPVVLGTELNTNGSIEYLCLGRGCERL